MADGNINEAEGIIVLDAADEISKKMDISHIVLTGTAAGSFVFILGNTTITITTGTADLSKIIPIKRTVSFIELTSGPTAAKLYAFLKRK